MKLNVRVAGDRRSWAGAWLSAWVLLLMAGILLYVGSKVQFSSRVSATIQNPPTGLGDATLLGAGAKSRTGSPITFASLPLSFEVNQGQTDPQVKFLARGGGYTLFLSQNEAVLKLQSSAGSSGSASQLQHSAVSTQRSATSVVRMKLVGANAGAAVSGSEQLSSRSNYFLGNDPAKWRRDVPQFARVRYGPVYPGVDLVYYGHQGRLEYDFEVAPGAKPEQIGLEIEGAQGLHLSANGDLVAETGNGKVQWNAPEVYQRSGDRKQAVAAKFVLSADNRVHFVVGEYDHSRALVIDPVLNYSTYLGGTGDEGCAFQSGTYTTAVSGCPGIAADAAGNIYVAGATTSPTFPPTGTAFQANNAGQSDVFIAKFNVNPNSVYSLVYWSFLGGTGNDTSAGIAVDFNLNVYVAGNTTSNSDFPMANPPNGYQTTSSGINANNHVFIAKLNPAGNTLLYATYLAGTGTDTATGLAVDTRANAYVMGTTNSTDYPATAGSFQATSPSPGNPEFFMSKVNTAGSGVSSLAYSTYFGASNVAAPVVAQGGGIAVDQFGFVYITGGTNYQHTQVAGDFPILNAFQSCLDAPSNPNPCPAATNADAFVAKLDTNAATGSQLKYSTYLGGSGVDIPYGIAVDGGGNAYVAGTTTSSDFIIPSGTTPFQNANGGSGDAFMAKIGSAGNVLSYFTYLGGAGTDIAYAIAVDVNQAAHITGSTTSNPFPTVDPLANTGAGTGTNAFVALIQTTFAGQTGGYSSYLETSGAGGNSDGTGIATDANANTYVAGETNSSAFPVTNSSVLNGTSDAFVSKITPSASGVTMVATTSLASGTTVGIGNQVTYSYAIKNTGPDVASNVIFTTTLPASGATFASASSTPGSCTAVVSGTVTCSIGSLGVVATTAAAQATVKINLTPTVSGTLSNTGTLQANGAVVTSQSASATVTDFTIGVSPSTNAVVAGNTATYQVQVGIPGGQTNFFPNAVSLSCSAGVPTGAACTFSTNPLTMTSTSAISSTLTITTTARPVTAAQLRFGSWYATLLPIGGLTFLGIGVGASRRRKLGIAIFGVVVFGLIGLQMACSGSSGAATPPAGTPAGTYAVTLTGTSGSASHATRMTLVVQ